MKKDGQVRPYKKSRPRRVSAQGNQPNFHAIMAIQTHWGAEVLNNLVVHDLQHKRLPG